MESTLACLMEERDALANGTHDPSKYTQVSIHTGMQS